MQSDPRSSPLACAGDDARKIQFVLDAFQDKAAFEPKNDLAPSIKTCLEWISTNSPEQCIRYREEVMQAIERDAERLVKSGDEMTGMLTVKPTSGNYGIVVQPGPDASGVADILRVRDYDDNQVFFADVSGGVGVNPSWTPSSANHLATKKYVDDNTGGDLKVPVGSGAPSGITVGSMWFDLTTNSLYIKVS